MATTKTSNEEQRPRTIADALAAAQAEMTDPVKDSVNPHFKSKFVSLCALLQSVRPILTKHGIAFTQTTRVEDDGRVLLVTRLHWHDEEITGYYPVITTKNDPQGLGSAITYAKRYALQAIVGVAADEDDDGNAASAKPSAPQVDTTAEVIGKIKACNDLEELRAMRADVAKAGAAAQAAWKARGEYLKAAAEAP